MDANQGEVVVVTGAGAGVGRAVVNEFARHGASIGLISRNSERLESAKGRWAGAAPALRCGPCGQSRTRRRARRKRTRADRCMGELHDFIRRANVHLTVVHLPAVNTRQFSWRRYAAAAVPQPAPPIFGPEVPARAIYWAAHHRRREVFVGGSTVKGDLRAGCSARVCRLVSGAERI